MDSPAVEKTNRSPLNAQLLSFAGRSERALRKLSIFWRLALSSLAIIIVVAGVNFYALSQLRQLTALSTELVSYHYPSIDTTRSEEHTSELQSPCNLVCRLLLEKKKKKNSKQRSDSGQTVPAPLCRRPHPTSTVPN